MSVKAKPDQYHTITPYIVVEDAEPYMDFLRRAFDAQYTECVRHPDGKIGHAEVRIGDSTLMIGSKENAAPPSNLFYLYVDNTDAAYEKALDCGAKSLMEPKNQFYGDRNALVEDPFGTQWCIATHIEDVSKEELDQRSKAYYEEQHKA